MNIIKILLFYGNCYQWLTWYFDVFGPIFIHSIWLKNIGILFGIPTYLWISIYQLSTMQKVCHPPNRPYCVLSVIIVKKKSTMAAIVNSEVVAEWTVTRYPVTYMMQLESEISAKHVVCLYMRYGKYSKNLLGYHKYGRHSTPIISLSVE